MSKLKRMPSDVYEVLIGGCSADNESRMKYEADARCMVKVDKRVEQ